MNKILCLFILFTLIGSASLSQIPDFYREDLFFTLDDSTLNVSGDYYFYNPHERPLRMSMHYPFPQDKALGKVSGVFAFNRYIPFRDHLIRYNQKAGIISLDILPKQSKVLRIGYSHELKADQATYILSTTSEWGKPFQQAYYELHVPFDIQVDSLSYEPDEIQQVGGLYIYIFKRRNFMPEKDFEIYFSN
ncbi:MAG: hypothetical protein U9R60_04820 [Bacteroidota bacterium]|nr:hypothetical protein [Bacteroidota bacterium]